MGFMSNPATGGEFTPFVSFNAKAGRWYTKKDEPDAAQFEVTNMTAIFDMDSLKTGWLWFASGAAPVKQFDPSFGEQAPKPGEHFKRGFEVNVFSEKNLLGLREFASTAGVAIEAMNDLYDHWLADKGKNEGKLPVVKCVGVTPVTNKHGTNYRPQLEIVSWADRPAELGNGSSPAASAATNSQQTTAAQSAPPARQAEPATAGADEPDF